MSDEKLVGYIFNLFHPTTKQFIFKVYIEREVETVWLR